MRTPEAVRVVRAARARARRRIQTPPPQKRGRQSARAQALLGILAALLIAYGVFLRFSHVDGRVFWDDEVIASLHILGTTEGEIVARAGELRTMADLAALVHPAGPLRPPAATIAALRSEDPQHPPLYYLAARLWAGHFGDSRAALRTLSAVIGCAALPAMFWLCLELFGSRLAAWTGVALLAVSPVAVLYSQEVREYGLWLVAILITSTLFVRAWRRSTITNWLRYALALGVSLYVFPLQALVAFAHAFTAVLAPAPRRERLAAFAAVTLGLLLFTPWLIVIVTHIGQIDRGMATIDRAPMSVFILGRATIGLIRLDVLDVNGKQKLLAGLLSVPIIGIFTYALGLLRSTAPPLARCFIWTLLGCTSLPIVLADFVLGGDRTATVRYFMPLFVALDLALVALLALKLRGFDWKSQATRGWAAAFALLFIARTASCALADQARMWWSDYNNRSIAIAAAINAAPRPLLISDDYIVWAISLSEYTDPKVRVALAPRCYLCMVPPAAEPNIEPVLASSTVGSVFLLAPSKRLQSEVKAVMRDESKPPTSTCIDVRDNCAGGLSLW